MQVGTAKSDSHFSPSSTVALTPPMSLFDSLVSQCYLMGNIPVLHVMTYQTL